MARRKRTQPAGLTGFVPSLTVSDLLDAAEKSETLDPASRTSLAAALRELPAAHWLGDPVPWVTRITLTTVERTFDLRLTGRDWRVDECDMPEKGDPLYLPVGPLAEEIESTVTALKAVRKALQKKVHDQAMSRRKRTEAEWEADGIEHVSRRLLGRPLTPEVVQGVLDKKLDCCPLPVRLRIVRRSDSLRVAMTLPSVQPAPPEVDSATVERGADGTLTVTTRKADIPVRRTSGWRARHGTRQRLLPTDFWEELSLGRFEVWQLAYKMAAHYYRCSPSAIKKKASQAKALGIRF